LKLKIRHGAIVDNIVTNLYAKFNDNRMAIRVASLQSSSNFLTFPWLFQVFPPQELYRQAYVYSWANTVALVAVHLAHVKFT